MLLTNGVA